MIAIGFLLIVAFIFIIIGHLKNGNIIISPITGMMFGFLYHKEEYIGENEYTLQCLIGVISINVIWIKEQDG
jgi:hypothetical protein